MPIDRNLPPRAATTRETAYDAGLRDFFRSIYNNLAIGLAFTGLVSWMVAATPALMHFFFGNHLVAFLVIFSPLIILWFGLSPARVAVMPSSRLAGYFYLLSALFGISFATIFYIYSGQSIARVFFIAAGTFAGTSAIGYSTKRDLSGIGAFGFMGLWGIILASIVNMFMHSTGVMLVTSIMGVIAMVCLIAWDTQMFKEMYNSAGGRENNQKLAIMAALTMYINFINLFQFLLQLMGDRR